MLSLAFRLDFANRCYLSAQFLMMIARLERWCFEVFLLCFSSEEAVFAMEEVSVMCVFDPVAVVVEQVCALQLFSKVFSVVDVVAEAAV